MIPVRSGLFSASASLLLWTMLVAAQGPAAHSWSPDWTGDLVIYEIAPKAFTSPNGPESGTFETLKAKLPYLQGLGITGIWLAGYSWSDPHVEFNIWTQYGCIDPQKIEPSLGTPQQFRALVHEAHRRSIRVFLDVVTHGLMPYSPIVKAHPYWFRGDSFGMVDFDWYGGHPDLDDWWVKVWTDYVTQYGIDGFRLDIGIYRPDLWARIRKNAQTSGHPIVIFEENPSGVIPDVTDFTEIENTVFQSSDRWVAEPDPILANDIPRFYSRKFGRAGRYDVKVEYEDGSVAEGHTDAEGVLRVRLAGLDSDMVSRRWGDSTGITDFAVRARARDVPRADGIPDVELVVENIADKPIRNVTISDDGKGLNQGIWKREGPQFQRRLSLEGHAPVIRLYISTLSYGSSIALSIHDIGDEPTSSAGEAYDPYTARGSRALFGYSFLFTPMIPLFMSGEEFDATFHAIPWMTPEISGGQNPGRGHMLYGSMLDWKELDQPQHRAMLEDVRRMLALRRQERAILTTQVRGDIEPRLTAVPYRSDIPVPAPYLRWTGRAGIVVLANRSIEAEAHLSLRIPIEKLGGVSSSRFRITDLWNEGAPQIHTARQLEELTYTVTRDKSLRGGIGLVKVELVQ